MLLEKIKSLKPNKLLDIGCGCGEFTEEIVRYCHHVTAIDPSEKLIERCIKENKLPNIEYLRKDGRNTGLPDKSFDCVIERDALHHMSDWDKAIDEMFRLSTKYVLVSEPLDDDRSSEKRSSNEAQNLFLELQHEAGYEHYRHIEKEILFEYFNSRKLKYECIIDKFDEIVEFDEYFNQYQYFADRTQRKDYWMNRLDEFRIKLNRGKLCAEDVINIFCEV